jgi:hypothetical protein
VSIIMTPDGCKVVLSEAFITAGFTPSLRLFKNDYTPTLNTVLGDLVQADFDTYAPFNLAVWSVPIFVDPRAVTQALPATWTKGPAAPNNQIYGCYLTDFANTKLYGAERFAGAPIPMMVNGQTLLVVPQQTYRSEFPTVAVVVSDSFTDADNTLLPAHVIAPVNTIAAAWASSVGSMKVLGNQAVVNALAGGVAISTIDGLSLSGTLKGTFPLTFGGLVFNYVDANNYNYASMPGGALQLREVIGGVNNNRAAAASAGITCTLKWEDGWAVAKDNTGVQVAYGGFAPYTSTRCGMIFLAGGSQGDDFQFAQGIS